MQPARILVIEDNPFDIVLLRHALDKQGEAYELEILSNGEDALRFVHEHRTRVREPELCVILLDLGKTLTQFNSLETAFEVNAQPVMK